MGFCELFGRQAVFPRARQSGVSLRGTRPDVPATAPRECWLDLVRGPLVFVVGFFCLSFWCPFLRLFTSVAILFFPAQVSFLLCV